MAKKKDKGSFSIKKILIWLILLVLVAAGGYVGYNQFLKKKAPSLQSLAKVELKPELIAFTFEQLPNLYPELVRLNDEIILIEQEMERLDDIATNFPSQRKIVGDEKTLWNKTLKELSNTLNAIEKEIETIYVTYLVHNAKGRQLIEEHQGRLTEAASSALSASSEYTQRLKDKEPQGFIEKIKQKFL
jgi:hypothetical protein